MALTDSILFQSIVANSQWIQQLSNLNLTGLSCNDTSLNTDDGKLYGTFQQTLDGYTLYTLNLYKDVTKFDLVAVATSETLGIADVVEANGSGLGGTVNFVQFQQEDNNIEALCFLSKDSDLPVSVANLTGISDYDSNLGFAFYHLLAFQNLQQFFTTRAKTNLWDPGMADTASINGGKGAYDFSRIRNWQCPEFIEASANIAFYRMMEKQTIDKDGTFYKRVMDSRAIAKGFMQNTELQFDLTKQRVESKSHSLRAWRRGRY